MSPAYVSANDENGERILHTAPSSPLPKAPALPPKQGFTPSLGPCTDSDNKEKSLHYKNIYVQRERERAQVTVLLLTACCVFSGCKGVGNGY